MTYAEARADLRRNRLARKKTLKDVATVCGMRSPSLVSEWESGARTPTYTAARAIERLFKTPRVEAWGFDRKTGLRALVAAAVATEAA